MGGKVLDMTETIASNAHRLGIDALGGAGPIVALHLHQAAGMNVLTLPKTIGTTSRNWDVSFGYDTPPRRRRFDRLHSTATSHNRLIVCEVMGNNAGWLALGAGIAGGADVILLPEIPYDLDAPSAEDLRSRRRSGKRFSIIVVAEGARSREEAEAKSRRGGKSGAKGGRGRGPRARVRDGGARGAPTRWSTKGPRWISARRRWSGSRWRAASRGSSSG